MINIVKSQPPPACLEQEKKKDGDYKCGDVLQRTKNDFLNKCYLCEWKEPHVINVEHFVPHKGDLSLKFDWNNLFWSCSHCNNVKLAGFNNILNCTDANDKVDEWLKYEMHPFPKEHVTITSLNEDPKVLETKDLLDKIYNGHTPLKKIESANLRQSILDEIIKFQEYLLIYYNGESTETEKAESKKEIIRGIRKLSNFTSFKRWIIRRNEAFDSEFKQFFD